MPENEPGALTPNPTSPIRSGSPSKDAWHYKSFWVSIGASIAALAALFQDNPTITKVIFGAGIIVGCMGNLVPLFFGVESKDGQ